MAKATLTTTEYENARTALQEKWQEIGMDVEAVAADMALCELGGWDREGMAGTLLDRACDEKWEGKEAFQACTYMEQLTVALSVI